MRVRGCKQQSKGEVMNAAKLIRKMTRAAVITLAFLITVLAGEGVFAHGGKSHGSGGEFTNLEALKKATELYDKLVASEKLDAGWETTVEKVQIAERRKGTEVEKVVSFSRRAGEPKTVYIFFKSSGEYAGSNFTGQ
jgi:hypothetical protein